MIGSPTLVNWIKASTSRPEKGWTVVDIKRDWNAVFPDRPAIVLG